MSFCSSTTHMAQTLAGSTRHIGGARRPTAPAASPEAAGSPASGTDIAEASRGCFLERVTGVGAEDVIERGPVVIEAGFEMLRGAQGACPATVHERDAVAVAVGLVHVVRRDQHGHAGGNPHRADALPDTDPSDRV